MIEDMDLPVLDSHAIDELKELDEDGALLEELIGMFVADSEISIQSMHEALSNNALDKLGKLAHKMKSGAGNLGAIRVAEICRWIEESARHHRMADYAGWIRLLGEEITMARQALNQVG